MKNDIIKQTKPKNFIVCVRSVVTGRIVWMWKGISKRATQKAYERACRSEEGRVRKWNKSVRRRHDNIRQFLNDLMSAKNPSEAMVKEAVAAVRSIEAMAETKSVCDKDFISHVRTMRDRRTKTLNKLQFVVDAPTGNDDYV